MYAVSSSIDGRSMPEVSAPYFSPHLHVRGARCRGCLTCDHFRGEFWGDHVVCERMARPSVIGDARIGCAYWMRAVGSDD